MVVGRGEAEQEAGGRTQEGTSEDKKRTKLWAELFRVVVWSDTVLEACRRRGFRHECCDLLYVGASGGID